MRGVLASVLQPVGFVGQSPGHLAGPRSLARAHSWLNAAVIMLKCFLIFEQEYLRFHFARSPSNDVAGSGPWPPRTTKAGGS